jgi:hypothetical protein
MRISRNKLSRRDQILIHLQDACSYIRAEEEEGEEEEKKEAAEEEEEEEEEEEKERRRRLRASYQ